MALLAGELHRSVGNGSGYNTVASAPYNGPFIANGQGTALLV